MYKPTKQDLESLGFKSFREGFYLLKLTNQPYCNEIYISLELGEVLLALGQSCDYYNLYLKDFDNLATIVNSFYPLPSGL